MGAGVGGWVLTPPPPPGPEFWSAPKEKMFPLNGPALKAPQKIFRQPKCPEEFYCFQQCTAKRDSCDLFAIHPPICLLGSGRYTETKGGHRHRGNRPTTALSGPMGTTGRAWLGPHGAPWRSTSSQCHHMGTQRRPKGPQRDPGIAISQPTHAGLNTAKVSPVGAHNGGPSWKIGDSTRGARHW